MHFSEISEEIHNPWQLQIFQWASTAMQVLEKLIRRCWDPVADNRPEFVEVVSILDTEIRKLPRESFHNAGEDGSHSCCTLM